ncbi:haloacid dehalogenase-like hydrolase [Aureibacillus halotolerans]|uniref:DUF7916 domain-containing protein n=1 Tax=Aureibacillus halotolerans TaxID=1508390 RepID=A0A4R6U099_9BACI|nr:haloacid dehalogenase-like hydrolase [Aureibacillus halotolerans]TDQ37685.1 hypothetical protein EV213_11245 [Aureibacillus halotolerans]
MTKRLLNCDTSDIMAMTKEELKVSIYASEGRTVLTEVAVVKDPIIDGVTNGEIAKFAGADLILLNAFDVDHPAICGISSTDSQPVKTLKKLTGRPIGANLEPVDDSQSTMDEKEEIGAGRKATVHTFKKANELGLDFICLTGNPGTGVTNEAICNSIQEAKRTFDGLIIAGKMHSSGIDEPIVDEQTVEQFIEAGADIILFPAVYTVPKFREEELLRLVEVVHSHNRSVKDPAKKVLTLSAIGTSQESSSKEVIQKIALACKSCGVDIHHIGDAGYSGLALYQNIDVLGNAIRGERHQLRMRAKSIFR